MNVYLIKEVETNFGKRKVGGILDNKNNRELAKKYMHYIDKNGGIYFFDPKDIPFPLEDAKRPDTITKITYCPDTNHFEIWADDVIIEEFNSTEYRIKR